MPIAKMKTRKVQMPMLTRLARIEPKTLDKENRTVEMVFTKGARVRRFDFFDGPFIEELGLKKSEVRMKRLKSGTAPFLDSHGFGGARGIRNAMGVIVSAELIPDEEGRATVKFSKRVEVEDIFQDIQDGILKNVSVGYNVHKIEKVGEENEVPIFRMTDWEPIEVSLVTSGADPEAQIRSKDAQTTECIVIENEEIRDEEPSETGKRSAPINQTVAKPENLRDTQQIGEKVMTPEEIEKKRLADEKIANEAQSAEKVRQSDIRLIFAKTKMDDDKLLTECIDSNKTANEVRTLVIDKMAVKDSDPKNQTRSANQASVGEDLGRKGRIEGMTSALLHRHRPDQEADTHDGKMITLPGYKLADSGREFAYFSLLDMARACLEANGVRTGMLPKHQLADKALMARGLHSISDFPEILANVLNKSLRAGYLAAPVTWTAFTNEVFVSDFKEISRTNLGDAAKLEKLEEGSEVKRGTISEAAEKYRVEEYAKIIAITRKIIVNDDLNFVTRLPERMGRRARDLESDTVWQIIKDNAALSDTFALFSAQHGNLSTSPAAPSEAGLGEGRTLMRRQTGLDGAEIAISPVWLYVPPAHETTAEKLVASIVPDSSTNVSPFSSAGRTPLRLDVEPRLETGANGSLTAWYLMASKGQIDMVELARLTGSNGPQTVSREGFDVHGMEIKIMHDIGAKAIDHRGLFRNSGA